MNVPSVVGAVVASAALFVPVPWAMAPWFAGIALFAYGRGVAAGEREMRRLWRGGE